MKILFNRKAAHDEEGPIQLAGVTDSSLPPTLRRGPQRSLRSAFQSLRALGWGRPRMLRVLNTIAAILIVGAIIGASLVLFSRHQAPSQVVTLDSQGKQVTVTSSAGGFEMVMRLTAGPYFLSEMLAVDISLTNHTDKAVHLGFPFEGYACGYNSSYDTGVQIVGGNKPEYTLPLPTDHSCPRALRVTSY